MEGIVIRGVTFPPLTASPHSLHPRSAVSPANSVVKAVQPCRPPSWRRRTALTAHSLAYSADLFDAEVNQYLYFYIPLLETGD